VGKVRGSYAVGLPEESADSERRDPRGKFIVKTLPEDEELLLL
jgi:hypothetical protein